MRVLVIPEDFRKDQYLLKPLFGRLFATMGGRNVRVRVCQDPLLGGVDEACGKFIGARIGSLPVSFPTFRCGISRVTWLFASPGRAPGPCALRTDPWPRQDPYSCVALPSRAPAEIAAVAVRGRTVSVRSSLRKRLGETAEGGFARLGPLHPGSLVPRYWIQTSRKRIPASHGFRVPGNGWRLVAPRPGARAKSMPKVRTWRR